MVAAVCPKCKKPMLKFNLAKYGRCFTCYMEQVTGADCSRTKKKL